MVAGANVIVALFGLLIVCLCLWAMAGPVRVFSIAARLIGSSYGLLVTIVPRLVFAAAMLIAAETSQAPKVLYLFGMLSLVGALLVPLIGRPRILEWLQLVGRWPGWVLRLWLMLAVLFGLFLIYAVTG